MTDTEDYSWDESSSLMDRVIDRRALPERFALTAPQVLTRPDDRAMLLIDPHPTGTWETWMFPYASLVLTSAEVHERLPGDAGPASRITDPPDGFTFRDLSRALRELKSALLDEYQTAIQTGVNNALPQLQGTWTLGAPDFANFSLKYSKTSESYTAYLFEYSVSATSINDPDLPFLWVTPADLAQQLGEAGDARVKGKTVSSNVVDALQILTSRLR